MADLIVTPSSSPLRGTVPLPSDKSIGHRAFLLAGLARGESRVRVRTPRGAMELKALVVPTIRPDTLFIPFHYGNRQAVNQLTIPAVDPTVKIPEYKVCAAMIERLDAPATKDGAAKLNFTPETAPAMFPYAVGETKQPQKAENLE